MTSVECRHVGFNKQKYKASEVENRNNLIQLKIIIFVYLSFYIVQKYDKRSSCQQINETNVEMLLSAAVVVVVLDDDECSRTTTLLTVIRLDQSS
jgi:hypothetical protein